MSVVAFVLLITAGARAYQLTVVHTNDVHSRFEQFNQYGGRCTRSLSQDGKCFGGVARQMTKVNEVRETNENVLFLNAGDYYQGTFMYTIHKWKVVADFMNRLGHDVMALGNHEFDDGVAGLLPFLENTKFPILGCNINVDKVPSLKGKIRSSIVRHIGGSKVGIIGYITPETKSISRAENVTFDIEDTCLKEEAKRLNEEGVKIIIALGHSGFIKDLQIAKDIPYVDIVVGGHTDTFLYSGNPPSIEKPVDSYPVVITKDDGTKTLVVQDYTYGKYLGFLKVTFTDDGNVQSWTGNPILLDSSVKRDNMILAALEPYIQDITEKSEEVVGTTKVLLLGKSSTCRMKECNMGNMLTDATVSEFSKMSQGKGWTDVSISLWNSGGIRNSIDETFANGNITVGDIMSVIPFANTFMTIELKGSDLLEAMEENIANYDITGVDTPGRFLQVSGLKVWYNLNEPPGKRVKKLTVKCASCRVPRYQPLNLTAVYKVIVPEFIYNGGDGFTVFKEKAISTKSTGLLDSEVVKSHIKTSSPITIGEEDRINFLESKQFSSGQINSQPTNTKTNIPREECIPF